MKKTLIILAILFIGCSKSQDATPTPQPTVTPIVNIIGNWKTEPQTTFTFDSISRYYLNNTYQGSYVFVQTALTLIPGNYGQNAQTWVVKVISSTQFTATSGGNPVIFTKQ